MATIWAETGAAAGGLGKAVSPSAIEEGRIAARHRRARRPPGDAASASSLPAPANLPLPRLPARDGGPDRAARARTRDSFWTWRQLMFRFLDRLTPEQVEAIAAFVQMEMLEAGYGARGRVPLPAPRARRRALCRPRRDVGADRGGGRDQRDRPDAAAGALPVRRLRRPAARRRGRSASATIPTRFARLLEGAGAALARLPADAVLGARAAFAARGGAGRPRGGGGAGGAGAGPHAPGRAGGRGGGGRGRPRRAAGGVGAGAIRARRALVPDPLHADAAAGDRGAGRDGRGGGALPDHRGEPRRRHLRRRALAGRGRADRHRVGQQHPDLAGRGAAPARELPAAARPRRGRRWRRPSAPPGGGCSRRRRRAARRRRGAARGGSSPAPGPTSWRCGPTSGPGGAARATRCSTASSLPAAARWWARSGRPGGTWFRKGGTARARRSPSATAPPSATCGAGSSTASSSGIPARS